MHTSASLTINENASPDVLLDLNVGMGDPFRTGGGGGFWGRPGGPRSARSRRACKPSGSTNPSATHQDSLDRIAPEGKMYRHDDEGPDDMPAHVKSSLMGASLTVRGRRGGAGAGEGAVQPPAPAGAGTSGGFKPPPPAGAGTSGGGPLQALALAAAAPPSRPEIGPPPPAGGLGRGSAHSYGRPKGGLRV